MTVTNAVRKRDLLRISLRLTLLQSAWCEGIMQSVGLTYALTPGLMRLFPDIDKRKSVYRQFNEPFNTHPFLVAVVAGATLRMEEQGRSNREIASFLRSTMGPLAALGDPFFHGALPPFVAATSALAALTLGVWAGIVVALVLFNTIHLGIRARGVFVGYKEGMSVLPRVGRWISPARTRLIRIMTAVVAGSAMAAVALSLSPKVTAPDWALFAAPPVGLTIAAFLTKWRSLSVYAVPVFITAIIIAEVLI